jgi:hypothetical protein
MGVGIKPLVALDNTNFFVGFPSMALPVITQY